MSKMRGEPRVFESRREGRSTEESRSRSERSRSR